MRKLGKAVNLRAIDMGYSPRWESRIKRIADHLELPLNVIKVAEVMKSDTVATQVRNDLAKRRNYLDKLAIVSDKNVTPCTNCYNCKIIAMTNHHQATDELLYFGHHSDDMMSSFLKSCIMYHDRWAEGHNVFERRNFVELAIRVTNDLMDNRSAFLKIFLHYLDTGLAATEEPVYENNNLHGTNYSVGRPLILVREEMLRAYSAALQLDVESSGCGHSVASKTRTPRELVQYEMLPALYRHPIGIRNSAQIEAAVFENLTSQGKLRIDARRNRDSLLGNAYKGGELQDKY